MPKTYRAAIIGAGSQRRDGNWGGMGRGHAHGYDVHPRCKLVAVSDIKLENAASLGEQYGADALYTSHRKMLKEMDLDIVSVCTWPETHCKIVQDCAKAGVKAIHSEKPMAPTWGEAQRMVATCEKAGVQLTFNHQRRFLESFQKAKELAHDGTIGELKRMEATCPNLMDWGTHWFDMLCFMNNETDVEWVIGQIDGRDGHDVFRLSHAGQGISYFKHANGVRGQLITGHDADIGGCEIRLTGDRGTIEISNHAPNLRVRAAGRKDWKEVKTSEGLHGMSAVDCAIADAIDCIGKKREPMLAARRALRSTELIFATYESSRLRQRIDLPLKTKDSALLTMLAEGVWAKKKR